MNHWFTSDTHYNHKNIVRGTSSWETGSGSFQETRDFDTLEEHNARLVTNFNSVVKENDILYHLGDWSFGGIEFIWDFRNQLKCKNIHLIFGNHDHHIENNKELKNAQWHDFMITPTTGSSLLLPPTAQRLFKSVSHYKEISLHGQQIIMSHYAMRVWNKSHHGSWMLYGHSHGTLPKIDAKTMDVGVDTNGLYPYSMDEIKKMMDMRQSLIVDHHSKDTN